MEPVTRVVPDANPPYRHSKALIGLAISVGTSSLLLPQQSHPALATPPSQIAADNIIPASPFTTGPSLLTNNTNSTQPIANQAGVPIKFEDLAAPNSKTVETPAPSIRELTPTPEPSKKTATDSGPLPATVTILENGLSVGISQTDADFQTPTHSSLKMSSHPQTNGSNSPYQNTSFTGHTISSQSQAGNTYIDSLRSDINILRQKYRLSKYSHPEFPGIPNSTNSVPSDLQQRANNPQILQAELEKLRQQQHNITTNRPPQSWDKSTPTSDTTEIATTPLGFENYDSFIKPQIVSPELPPLKTPDAYLPEQSVSHGYIWPAQGLLTSGFGWRWGRIHAGIDIAAPVGTPIVAAAAGVVIFADWDDGGYGNRIDIQHPDGTITRYAHNNRILVRPGQQVAQGEQISEMGSTGYSSGPHLHFEIHPAGQSADNPLAYLPSVGNW